MARLRELGHQGPIDDTLAAATVDDPKGLLNPGELLRSVPRRGS